jgi:hypothetical protein
MGPNSETRFMTDSCVAELPVTVQMGHNKRDRIKDYWPTLEKFLLPFLYFSYRNNEPDKTDGNCDKLWIMKTLFDKPNYV